MAAIFIIIIIVISLLFYYYYCATVNALINRFSSYDLQFQFNRVNSGQKPITTILVPTYELRYGKKQNENSEERSGRNSHQTRFCDRQNQQCLP